MQHPLYNNIIFSHIIVSYILKYFIKFTNIIYIIINYIIKYAKIVINEISQVNA